MQEVIKGSGEIRLEGQSTCRVTYQLELHEGDDEHRFTLTDGVIEIEQPPGSETVIDLEPGQELILRLHQPLRDGRDHLTLVVEPYAGHRPDERYQVSIRED